MGVISDLQRLSSAEEFFDYLEVAFDPQVLNVSRLHVMRVLGDLLKVEALECATGNAADDEDAVRARIRSHLGQAYDTLKREGPLQKRLFKVHQDAVTQKTPSAAFVPLSTLTPKSARPDDA